jgi:hypothetical protein
VGQNRGHPIISRSTHFFSRDSTHGEYSPRQIYLCVCYGAPAPARFEDDPVAGLQEARKTRGRSAPQVKHRMAK